MNDVIEPHSTTAVNAGPEVLGDLLELDPRIADEIMYLVAGVEHYRNIRLPKTKQFNLSLEELKDPSLLSKLIDTLIRFIKRVLRDIGDGSLTLGISLGKVVNRAELINTESRTSRKINPKGEFKIDTRVANLCVNYRPLNDPQQLLMFLKANDVLFKGYFKYQNTDLLSVIPFLNTIRPEEDVSVIKLVDLLTSVAPATKAKLWGMSQIGSDYISGQLFGNQRLHILNRNASGEPIDQLLGQELLILPASDSPKPIPQSITYKSFAATLEQAILRQVITTGSDLESNFNIVVRNRRATRTEELTRYLDQIRNKLMNGQYNSEAQTRAEQIVQLLEVYTTWIANPYLNLMALYIRNMNAILNVCTANN